MLKHKGDRITRRSLQSLYRVRLAIASAGTSAFVLALLALSHWSLQQDAVQSSPLTIKTPVNTLRVVTRIGPTTYYGPASADGETVDDASASGFEYQLLKQFADKLGKELEIVTASSIKEVFAMLDKQQVHLAAAGLPITREGGKRFAFTTPYAEIAQQVVYRVGNKRPRKVADLVAKEIVVVADSVHASTLATLQKKYPGIHWREVQNSDYIDVLEHIEGGDADYTIMGSNEFKLHRGFFPRVKEAFQLGDPETIAWALPKAFDNGQLHRAANAFFKDIQETGQLAVLKERFFGQAAHVSQVAANEFSKNIERRLPRHVEAIKATAKDFNMDWNLLAAISYQESAWDSRARSHTGVRGLMMLTLPTAKEVGVDNRLDPVQSLRGGATYYQSIKRRLPERIGEPDRSWMALAAYNVGIGHLHDARILTEKRGYDPDLWFDVKNNLPLLAQRDWYSQTRHGYARGHEPVTYVQNIRHYYNVLRWDEWKRSRKQQPDFEAPIAISDSQESVFIDPENATLATSDGDTLDPLNEGSRSL